MEQVFTDFEGEFLSPSEDNFSSLINKIELLHDTISQQAAVNVPRIPMDKRDIYRQSFSVPQKGSTSTDVFTELAQAFQGAIRWHQPTALVNITPNPLLDAVAASTMASLYNMNALWDYTSGNVIKFEQEVVNFLGHLANWTTETIDGLSMSGGKATIMYAIKCGLNNSDRSTVDAGLKGEYVVIAGATSHYSIEDCCNYLGIGRRNVIRVLTDETGAMNPVEFEIVLRRALKDGKKVAAIIALGGDTLEHAVDPVKKIHDIRVKVAQDFNLDYVPYLHLDSVNAWISLAFRDYDFIQNPFNLNSEAKRRIQTLSQRISEVTWADSFSADFHKTGLTPYVSSFFVTKDYRHIQSINKHEKVAEKPSYLFGEVHAHHVSFDNSRSATGILSAWTSIKRLGIEGYQRYWAQLTVQSVYLRSLINMSYKNEIVVLNTTALGHPNVLQLVPPGMTCTYDDLLFDHEALSLYTDYCFELYDFMAHQLLKNNREYPLLGFIPSYKYEITSIRRPAFLLYLNHPDMNQERCDQLLKMIIKMKHDFERYRKSSSKSANVSSIKHLPK